MQPWSKFQANPQIHMELQGAQDRQNNLEKEQSWRPHISWFLKAHNKAMTIKTVWYWHKDKHTGWWNRTETAEMNPHIYGQLIFNEGAKSMGKE